MPSDSSHTIKNLNALGSALLAIALFIEAYSYSIITADGSIYTHWSYSFMLGWSTTSNPSFAKFFHPNNLDFPFALNIFCIGVTIASIYVNFSKPLEEQEDFEALKPYSIILFLVPLLAAMYLIIFPCMFLFPNEYYFPFVEYKDGYSTLTRVHSISIGYIFIMVGFVLTVPYSAFYYQAILRFETASKLEKKERVLASYQEEIDLDEMIAQETIKMKHSRRN